MTRNGKHSLTVISASVLYAAAVVTSAWYLRSTSGLSEPVLIIVAGLPIIFGAVAVWTQIRQINAMDEYLRQIQLNSLAIAAAGTAFLTIAYGSLEAAGFPRLSMFYVAPLTIAIWVASNFIQFFRHAHGASRI